MKKFWHAFLAVIFIISSSISVTSALDSAQKKEQVSYSINQAVLGHSISTHIFDNINLLDSDLRLAIEQPKDLDYLLLKIAVPSHEIPLLLSLYKNIMHKYAGHIRNNFEVLYYQRLVYFINALPTMPSNDKQKLQVTLQALKDDNVLIIPLVKFSIRFMSIVTDETLSIPLKKRNVDIILDDFNAECRAALPAHEGSDAVPLNAHINQFNESFKKCLFDETPSQRKAWWKRWYHAATSQKLLLGLNMVGVLTTAIISIIVVHTIQRFVNKGKTIVTNVDGGITQGKELMADVHEIVKHLKGPGIESLANALVTTVLDNPEKVKTLYQKVFDVSSCTLFIEAMQAIAQKYCNRSLTEQEILMFTSNYYRRIPQEVSEKILMHVIDTVLELVQKNEDDPKGAAFKRFSLDIIQTVVGTLADKGVITKEAQERVDGLGQQQRGFWGTVLQGAFTGATDSAKNWATGGVGQKQKTEAKKVSS